MTEHLGQPPGGTPNGPNVRNGRGGKTVQTDVGRVAVTTPRDRDGSCEPQTLPRRATRLAGLDDKVLGLYAGGMTIRDAGQHLSEIYATEIGRDTIFTTIDAVLEDVLISCVDGLKGFPEAIEATFPRAWVQPASST